jgi:hypothetical protein
MYYFIWQLIIYCFTLFSSFKESQFLYMTQECEIQSQYCNHSISVCIKHNVTMYIQIHCLCNTINNTAQNI